jgi:plastocyanin
MVRLLAATLLLAALVAAALTLRGADASPAPTRARDGRIALALDDFRFDPQVIRARKGPLTFELHNRGRLGHGFRLRKNGRTWLQEPSLRPGERRTVTRRLEPGDYRMFDAISNYEELGMYGTVVVR